jgi:hypothetical protein
MRRRVREALRRPWTESSRTRPVFPHVLRPGIGLRPPVRKALTARNRSNDNQGLRSRRDRTRQGSVRRLMRQIFFACEKAQERSPLQRNLVADRPPQHWITILERVEDRTLGGRALDFEFHLATNVRQRSQVLREYDSDHAGVITPVSAPQPKARPGDPGQSAPSCLRHRRRRTPARRSCRNTHRTHQASPPPSHRAIR